MFRLLMKHDSAAIWQRQFQVWRITIPVFLVSLLLILTRIPFLTHLSQFAAILTVLAFGAGPAVIIVYRYYQSMVGREAYLTHTLPLKAGTLYGAKLAVGVLGGLLGLILGLLTGFLTFLTILSSQLIPQFGLGDALREALHMMMTALPHMPWAIMLFAIVFSLFSLPVKVFFCISKGSEARYQHLGVGGPIIWYIVLYLIEQALAVAAMLFIPFGIEFSALGNAVRFVNKSSLASMLEALQGGSQTHVVIGLGVIPLSIGLHILYLICTVRSIKQRTSVR